MSSPPVEPASTYTSVIIHHGDPEPTLRCLESCVRSEPRPEQVILVWNQEGSPVELPELEVELIVVEPGENLGFSGGANLGIREAASRGARRVLLLNNDARIDGSAPRSLLHVLESDARVGMVGPRILHAPGGRTNAELTVWHDGGKIDWPAGRPRGVSYPDDEPGGVEFVCGCAPMIRIEAFEDVGGFDERYFLTFEDVDLSLRLRERGWKLVHHPGATVVHEGSRNLEQGPLARYYRLRNRYLLVSEHAPDPDTARQALRRERRRQRWRAVRCFLTGRVQDGRAILGAVRDFESRRFGRWGHHPSNSS